MTVGFNGAQVDEYNSKSTVGSKIMLLFKFLIGNIDTIVVKKEPNKGLSTNDFTDEYRDLLDIIKKEREQ